MNEIREEEFDAEFDAVMSRSTVHFALSAEAARLARALPQEAQQSRRRRNRWVMGAALAASLSAVGATAAVAAPLLLAPIPGYSQVTKFSYGVAAGEPGISCTSLIAIKPTPKDPKFDASVVTQFRAFLTSQNIEIAVPASAREPFTGDQSQLPGWPGTVALNESYSETLGALYAQFDSEVGEVSHSLVIQDSATCEGHK